VSGSWTPSTPTYRYSPYSYTVGPAPRPVPRVSTSRTELVHLVIAYSVLTLDMALILSRILSSSFTLIDLGLTAAGAALTGFVVHEMSHKVAAQRMGFWAEFRLSPVGLFISVLTALYGFLFAAPGATMIGGMGDARSWGRTSLAGPLSNLAQGGIFLLAARVAYTFVPSGVATYALLILAFFNADFAAFNMIPLGPLDGRKVYRWSRPAWVATFLVSLAFVITLYYVLFISGQLSTLL
jgi:Zn-dependent protease